MTVKMRRAQFGETWSFGALAPVCNVVLFETGFRRKQNKNPEKNNTRSRDQFSCFLRIQQLRCLRGALFSWLLIV